jgi:hypothetical protein
MALTALFGHETDKSIEGASGYLAGKAGLNENLGLSIEEPLRQKECCPEP